MSVPVEGTLPIVSVAPQWAILVPFWCHFGVGWSIESERQLLIDWAGQLVSCTMELISYCIAKCKTLYWSGPGFCCLSSFTRIESLASSLKGF